MLPYWQFPARRTKVNVSHVSGIPGLHVELLRADFVQTDRGGRSLRRIAGTPGRARSWDASPRVARCEAIRHDVISKGAPRGD